jgi:aspartate racemase
VKTIGLIGGMTWESSAVYYRLINQGVRRRLGSPHSAKVVMVSIDFAEMEVLQLSGRWTDAGAMLGRAAFTLEAAGADFAVLCTNTMHKVADQIAAAIRIPLLHIADATAERIGAAGVTSVGLLGTRYTMEQAFYRDRLKAHGIDVLTPGEADRELVHRVIYEELAAGNINDGSKVAFTGIMERLVQRGAGGIVLGCTEIGMLVGQEDASVPVFDTTAIHSEGAVELALA